MKKYTQRTRCLIQGCLYGLPFKKPKKNCMFCGEPRQELGVYSDATKPESGKEKCLHDHLCCPGDIKTVRCAYCGKSMYHEPQEELKGFTMDELDRAVEKSIKDGTNPYLKEEELEVEEPMSFLEKVVRQLEERVVGLNNRVLKLEETKSKKTNG